MWCALDPDPKHKNASDSLYQTLIRISPHSGTPHFALCAPRDATKSVRLRASVAHSCSCRWTGWGKCGAFAVWLCVVLQPYTSNKLTVQQVLSPSLLNCAARRNLHAARRTDTYTRRFGDPFQHEAGSWQRRRRSSLPAPDAPILHVYLCSPLLYACIVRS